MYWAEDDNMGPWPPCLESYSEPANNSTYVTYHGTSKEAAESIRCSGFSPSNDGMLGRGVYVSRDIQKASRYPLNVAEGDRRVLVLKVNVGKVKKIDSKRHPLQKTWHAAGYDTAWVPPKCGMVPSGLEEDCVWDPCRINVISVIQPIPQPSTISVIQPIEQPYSEPANNSTYVMYHSTSKEAAESIRCYGFSPSEDGMLGPGVYVSRDIQKARRYPLNVAEGDRRVLVLIVNVGRVKKINYQGHPLQKTWHAEGYDTAWVPPNCGMVSNGLEEDCVWDPRRIKVTKFIKPKPHTILFHYLFGRMYWAEDDMMGPRPPCLESYSEPANNSTYRMYHGTSKEAVESIKKDGFSPSEDGMLGPGVYLSRDIQKASRYPLNVAEGDRRVLVVIVNVGRVKKIDRQGHPLQKTWHAAGYDTAWVPPNCGMVPSGLEEDCVWDPSRIKVTKVIKPKSQPSSSKGRGYDIMRNGFTPSKDGMLGRGVYLSRDIKKASRYPLNVVEGDRRVLVLKVNVGKVKKIDHQGHPLQKTWHDAGYNTAWVPPNCGMVPSGLEEDCIWNPCRIKVIRVIEPEPSWGYCNVQ
ncbi:uncharacterized protein LOC133133356 [Conger conger]|uniref:uncharacterized protein LOC133133356 n=1 Tax=Conger conger TaxID=82655 RepID=UPI002A59AA55|nr:uncharacterized protein LOC133133356 [Conger conger]